MEKEFGCKIHYPKKKEKVHGKMTEIKITSPQSAENVLKCRDALEVAVEKARKQAMPTHFVSVPVGLTSVKIREQYQNFVNLKAINRWNCSFLMCNKYSNNNRNNKY
uniref:Uncharacterized protein n=1 Tax=Meloidogyne incognita TaxID=6306 RepID=A0A914NZ50_MELIC